MQLSDVRYQPAAQRMLQKALHSRRLPHAYIFAGPSGVGKEMLATRFATLLCCENQQAVTDAACYGLGENDQPIAESCGQCQSCHLMKVGNHPDLHLVYRQLAAHHPDSAVRNRKSMDFSIEVIRQALIEVVGTTPAMGRAKVFIVRAADRLTTPAQNAILKTLEEPPRGTYLILLVSSKSSLLPTTRSRCQIVEFGTLPPKFVAEQLVTLDPEVNVADARLYAHLAQGSLGAACEFASENIAERNRVVRAWLIDLCESTAGPVAKQLIDAAKELGDQYTRQNSDLSEAAAQRKGLHVLFVLVATWFRDLLQMVARGEDLVANRDALDELQVMAKRMSWESAVSAAAIISAADAQLMQNVNGQLVTESMLYKLAGLVAAPQVVLDQS